MTTNRFLHSHRFPRPPSARDRLPKSALVDLEATRSFLPILYRTFVSYFSIPRFTLYIRIILITAIVVLTPRAILLVRLDLGIEAVVLLIVLCFHALTRFFAVILLRTAEGLNRFYRLIRIAFHRQHRRR